MTAKEWALDAIITEQNARLDAAEKSLRLLAEDHRKQHALNEELWAWFESDCSDEISESLCAAFVDVLKHD